MSHSDLWVGTSNGGGDPTKQACNRTIFFFDLLGTVIDGLAIGAGATIAAATLSVNADSGGGAPGTCRAVRITRANYFGYDHTTWNEYDTGNAWTAGGGDIDATYAQTFPVPASLGPTDLCDLAAMAQDALENHGGILVVMLHVVNDTAIYTTTSTAWRMISTDRPNGEHAPRLVVSHNTQIAAAAQIDRRDPAKLPGNRPARAHSAPGAARPATPARPARS